MPKRLWSQPNLFRATKMVNKLVDSQETVKGKKQPTRKAKRRLQRLEKKRRRATHLNRKAAPTEVAETDLKIEVTDHQDSQKDAVPVAKRAKKHSHDGVTKQQNSHKDEVEISKLEKLMGMKPSKKKKKLPASFRADGLDYILDITDKVDDKDDSEMACNADVKKKKKKTSVQVKFEESELGCSGESDVDVQSGTEFDDEGSQDDDLSDGYLSDSGSDTSLDATSEHDDVTEETSDRIKPYLPPQLQSQTNKLKLKKSINGLINRLSTSNMSFAVGQMEKLFQSYSRNDVSTTFTEVVLEACLLPTILPDKFGLDYTMLVAIMHSQIGSEIGAHFLEVVVTKFDGSHRSIDAQRDKCCYNSVLVIAYLYNYLVVDCVLIYDIVKVLVESFTEGDVEILLMLLKNCGMQIRRDNASSLKDIIQLIQTKSSNSSGSGRMQFMLDIITSLRTNNPQKIPGYDPDRIENMRKLLRTHIKGSLGDNQLKISLQDLLNAEHQGRWWIVGSSWSNKHTNSQEKLLLSGSSSSQQSHLMELARKQRMNTDVRKSVFCVIMSSEDYIDAFEKLLRLGLKDTQQRELVHVTLHCCLQEKCYNPYYAFLGQKLCEYNRSHQVTFQYALWDKFKELHSMSSTNLDNLWRLCSHLIVHKACSLSILRAVQFTQLDVTEVRFFTKLLQSLLTEYSEEQCRSIFSRVANFDHLKVLRESLIFFMRHFLHKDSADETLNARELAGTRKDKKTFRELPRIEENVLAETKEQLIAKQQSLAEIDATVQKDSIELEKWKEESQKELDKVSAIHHEIAQKLEGLMATKSTMSDQLVQQSDCLSDKKQAMLQVLADNERSIDKSQADVDIMNQQKLEQLSAEQKLSDDDQEIINLKEQINVKDETLTEQKEILMLKEETQEESEISDLQQEVAVKEQELVATKNEMSYLHHQLLQQSDLLSATMTSYADKQQASHYVLADKEKIIEELQADNEKYKSELNDAKDFMQQLKNKQLSMEQKLDDENKEMIERLRVKDGVLAELKDELISKQNCFDTAVSRQSNELEELQKVTQEQSEEISNLQKQIAQKQEELAVTRNEMSDLHQQCDDLSTEIACKQTTEHELADKERIINTLQAHIVWYKAESNNAKNLMQQLKIEQLSMKQEIADSKKEMMEKLRVKDQALAEWQEELLSKESSFDAAVCKHSDEMKELQRVTQEHMDNILALQEEVARKEEELAVTRNKMSDLHHELMQQSEHLNAEIADKQTMKHELADKNQIIDKLQADVTMYEVELDNAKESLNQLKMEWSSMKQEFVDSEKEMMDKIKVKDEALAKLNEELHIQR